jgi:thiamine-monophosphate kinase
MDEFKLIEKIKKKIPRALQGEIGIGDDAGIFTPPPGQSVVWTVDALVDGVDFRRKELAPEIIGRKALAINLSDLAAMGAKPLGCVITLGLPGTTPESWVLRFYDGLVKIAKEYGVLCVGGDLTRASEISVSIAMAGSVPRGAAVRRNGAKPGHWIAVTGALGGSISGHHAGFTPRVREAQFLRAFKPSAMIDISDGLIQDLGHILKNSKVGASLEMSEIPMTAEAVRLEKRNAMKAFERACTDGEDFELLFTLPAAAKLRLARAWEKKFPKVPLSWIGRIERPKGLRWTLRGKPIPAPRFKSRGYRHFK